MVKETARQKVGAARCKPDEVWIFSQQPEGMDPDQPERSPPSVIATEKDLSSSYK